MGNQLSASLLLSLRDQFSSGIRRAGSEVIGFGETANKVMDGIDKATSGAAAKLGALGLGFGAGATVKGLIDYQARLTRLATAADMSDAQLGDLKKQIYAVSSAPEIKVDPSELTGAIEEILQRTGDLNFATSNIKALGAAIQASGANGQQIGGLAAEFNKVGFSAGDLMATFDVLTKQGKAGAFTFENFSSLGPRLLSAYGAATKVTAASAKDLGATMQIIMMGAGSADQAATSFEATMRNFTDPVKQKELKKLGISVRDVNGQFRGLPAILQDIVAKGKKMGNLDKFGTVFDSEAMRAVNAFSLYGDKLGSLLDVTGDGSAIMADASRNANTLQSGLRNVQTSFTKFADNNLTAPLGALSGMLNTLAEKPLQVKAAFTTMAVAIGAVAAVKGFKALQGFVADFKGLNPKASAGGLSGAGASAGGATPVTVTNWPAGGLGGGGTGVPGGGPDVPGESPAGGPSSKKPSRLSNMKAGALSGLKTSAALGVVTAGIGVVTALTDKDASSNEKAKAIGNSVGSAAGSVVGAAIGAGLGSIVPGIGTAIGGIVGGMLGGWLGGMGGESVGAAIENTASGRDKMPATQLAGYSTAGLGESQLGKSQLPPSTGISGKLELTTKVETYDNRTVATVKADSVPAWMKTNTGSSQVARGH
jgi:hypothetical protein